MNNQLRGLIINEMGKREALQENHFKELYDRNIFGWYCTWWFKFNLNIETKIVRRELERMERDGLVKSDRSQSNNTKWLLILN